MIVGVPGTGIGGIYYLLMAALMPLKELGKLAQGRSSLRTWLFIARQLSLLGAIVGAMAFTQYALRVACESWAAHTDNPRLAHNLDLMVRSNTGAIAGFAAFASIVMLGAVLVGVQVLRLWVRSSSGEAATSSP